MPSSCRRDQVDGFWFGHRRRALCFTRLYLHRITSVVISELASCHKEFQNPVMKALRYKQLDATCFCKYRDACSVTSLNRIEHRCALVRGEGGGDVCLVLEVFLYVFAYECMFFMLFWGP